MNWISTYSHKGRIGVLVELHAPDNSIRSQEEFIELCQDMAIHVAASDPTDIDDLLSQSFVKNPDQKVLELLKEKSESSPDSISIVRFCRWDTGTPFNEDDPRHDPALAMQVKGARFFR